MRIGIVAEGPADIAVLMNILFGKLGIERRDVQIIRPELTLDETDLAEKRRGGFKQQKPEEFSNWALVLKECRERTRLADFLDTPIAEDRLVVIHIDTAEAELKGFDVERPERKAPGYVATMRDRVAALLGGLLGDELASQARFAIAVEETDAWVLTLYDAGNKDTGSIQNPKKKLDHVRGAAKTAKPAKQATRASRGSHDERQPPAKKPGFEVYLELSRGFRDGEVLDACASRNASLRKLVDSL